MKLILASLVVAIGFAASAQWNIVKIPPSPNVLNTTDFSYPPALTIADPYRVINNITQRVDRTWLAIKAEVIQVHPREGVRVKGIVEGINMQDEDFFIINLPYLVAEKSVIPAPGFVYLFRPAGTYTYSTAAGSSRTIRQFDYGTPWKPPALTPEELAAF